MIYKDRGDFDRAEAAYIKLLKIAPDHPYAYFDLGYIYMKEEDDRAIRLLRKAVDMNPRNVYALQALGNIYKERGRYEEALSEFEKVLRIDPSYRYALWDEAEVYDGMGLKDKAEEQYRRYHEITDCSFRRFWNCFD